MKIFKKRKDSGDSSKERVPFESIVKNVLDMYKDNIMCSDATRQELANEIIKKIREQLSE